MTSSFRAFVLLSLILTPLCVHGKTLSETQIYKRCYAQLTESAPPLNDARRLKVVAKTMTGAQACIELLNEAKLNDAGMLVNATPAAKKILKTLNGVHRSWFTASRFDAVAGFDTGINTGTGAVFDQTEPSLFLTKYLFTSSLNYKNMLRGNQGVRAIRQADPNAITALNAVTFSSTNVDRYISSVNANSFGFMPLNYTSYDMINFTDKIDVTQYTNLPIMTAGEVVGIQFNDLSATIPNFSVTGFNQVDNAQRNYPDIEYSFDIYKNRGGGLIGSPAFFLLNSGHPRGTLFNGATKVPRAWSRAIMESLMCTSLPSLRTSDTMQFVQTNSTTSFRNFSSCVKCHATLDPFAYTARNLVIGDSHAPLSGITYRDGSKFTLVVSQFKPSLASVSGWPSEPVANFHRQQPTGTLRFRTSSGTLVEKSVNGIEEMGQALTDNEDYYRCAAKRYFEYFTGISVPMHDLGNPDYADITSQLSATTLADRKYVEQLGAKLQSTGSLLQLVQDIMQSNYYKYSNFRNEGN